MVIRQFIFLIAVVGVIYAEYVSYEKYKVYKILPKSENEVQALLDLRNQNKHMFWSDIVSVTSDVRIMVAAEKQTEFEKFAMKVNISSTLVIDNVQELINKQLLRPATRNSEYNWDYYLTLNEINEWLDQVAENYPDVVTIVNIGSSSEGKDIKGVKIEYKKKQNPIIGMIEGGIHAREWISPATVTYIINEFLTSTDPEVRAVAENIVWHIFPVVNPDGYEYTFSDNRMWRKSRNPEYQTNCEQWNLSDERSIGVDLNRNFGFVWRSTATASPNPCADNFAGPAEFSEPESRAIRHYVTRIQAEGRMMYYFAFHSFSQMTLVPYSHVGGADVITAPNYADMFEVAARGMDVLESLYGTKYIVGTSKDILYEVSGSSFDWARGIADIPIVYLFELRDKGQYGFLLPADQIVPNSREIVTALVEMEKSTRGLRYYQNSVGKVIYSFLMLIVGLIIAV